MNRQPITDINPTPLEIGISDEVLLLVSLLGFTFLFAALACLCHSSPSQAKHDEDNNGANNDDDGDNYDKLLEGADVSTLNRAQRKARAKLLMKKKKRMANEQRRGENDNEEHNNEGGNNDEMDGEGNNDINNSKLSRKERQKAAKEEERFYRREYEEIRKQKVQEEKERREAKEIRLKEKKALIELERQEALDLEIKSWKYFFGDEVTVNQFVEEIKEAQVIDLEDTASRFSVSVEEIVQRLNDLQKDRRINHGIFDKERGKYYYISESDMAKVSSYIKSKKHVSTEEIISTISQIIVSKTTSSNEFEGGDFDMDNNRKVENGDK